jgi:hypothetical protein
MPARIVVVDDVLAAAQSERAELFFDADVAATNFHMPGVAAVPNSRYSR